MVGNSGTADERASDVTASARSFPSRTRGRTTGMGLNIIVTRPPTTSGIAATTPLSRRYPQIVVRVVQANAETLEFRELQERRVDLALARVPRSVVDDGLDVEILFDDPHRVVVGARSLLARRRKITLAELVAEPWIFPSSQVIRELIIEAFKARGLEGPEERVSASSILLRNHLLETGRFLTVLPDSVLQYNAKQWSLKALPVDLGVKLRSVAIVTLKNRTVSPVVGLFIEHLRAVAKTMSAPSGSS